MPPTVPAPNSARYDDRRLRRRHRGECQQRDGRGCRRARAQRRCRTALSRRRRRAGRVAARRLCVAPPRSERRFATPSAIRTAATSSLGGRSPSDGNRDAQRDQTRADRQDRQAVTEAPRRADPGRRRSPPRRRRNVGARRSAATAATWSGSAAWRMPSAKPSSDAVSTARPSQHRLDERRRRAGTSTGTLRQSPSIVATRIGWPCSSARSCSSASARSSGVCARLTNSSRKPRR